MLPPTEFILVVVFLILALLVLTAELHTGQPPQSELPEELSPQATQNNQTR